MPLSALSSFIDGHLPKDHSAYDHNLALQIQYNLEYQHDWTSLHVHTRSPITQELLPRPLVSGLPPHRIYVHPDDQVEEVKMGVKDVEIEVEREWVLPTNLKEKWSLRRVAQVFDAIGEKPPIEDDNGSAKVQSNAEGSEERKGNKKRRGGKRLMLATIADDSTVVYYIVHDGIVKPRQN